MKAKLVIELRGKIDDNIKSLDGSEIYQKGCIYELPDDWDLSSGYFELIEEKKTGLKKLKLKDEEEKCQQDMDN
jgi:hypothetical protein